MNNTELNIFKEIFLKVNSRVIYDLIFMCKITYCQAQVTHMYPVIIFGIISATGTLLHSFW